MQPFISVFSNLGWPRQSALVLQNAILSTLMVKDECSVVLTGGKTAARLYKEWALIFEGQKMAGTNFYFGDERCVPSNNDNSNFNMVMNTLFFAGLPSGCFIHPIDVEGRSGTHAARMFEKIIPREVDILILTVGGDGHIASLFPGSSALKELCQSMAHILGPCEPRSRVTITPIVINNAKRVFLLGTGSNKGLVLSQALHNLFDTNSIPAILARRGVLATRSGRCK